MPINLIQRPIFLPASFFSGPGQVDHEDQSLAIIPYRPSLHAEMIRIWAQAQENQPIFVQQEEHITGVDVLGTPSVLSQPSDFALAVYDGQQQNPEVLSVALPTTVSNAHPWVSLEDSLVRRSTRQNKAKDGFKYYQLEDHLRKKRCVWAEVPVSSVDADKLLAKPPKPDDEKFPGQIPDEVLKTWGVICRVDPEDLTDEALNQGPLPMVINDDTTD